MEQQTKIEINGVTFTTEYSYITVLYTGELLMLDFPYNPSIQDKIKTIPGRQFNLLGNKKWTLPKNASTQLKEKFPSNLLSFKSNDEIRRDASFLGFQEESLEEVLARIPRNIDTSFMKLPPRNFQKVTIGWVATPKGKRGNVFGGILGDTMGLGKTIQALASAAYLKHTGQIKRCLIVTEAGLKDQWAGEVETFTNESYIVIQGNGKANQKPFEHRRELLERVQTEDIFYTITSYELLAQREVIGEEEVIEKGKTKKKQIKGDYTDLKNVLENNYDMIVLDEAQKIRNLDTLVCKAIYEIQSPKYRLIMTGTPIENNIENIFPLVDYLSPNIFADASLELKERLRLFEDKFLIKSLNPHALPRRVPEPVGVKNLDILNKYLMPYMLRRSLNDVGDEMPKANIESKKLDWDDHQFVFYNEIIETLQIRNEEWGDTYKAENAVFGELEAKRKKGHADAKLEDSFQKLQKKRMMLENEVQALRLYSVEITDTPELLLWSESPIAHRLLASNQFYGKIHKKAMKIRKDPTLNPQEVEEKLHALFEKEVPTVPKLQFYLDKIIELCLKNNEKVITFTKFETMAKILERKADMIFNPDKYAKKKKKNPQPLGALFLYTGSTKKGCQWKKKLKKDGVQVENPNCSECPFLEKCNTRAKAQWHLQNDPFTKLLIATDAANAGVNLQAARYNFNYDLPDSPSRLNQRNGRIQRIGSNHKTVFFFNLLTTGGIDEAKFTKIMKKQDNINTAIDLNEEQKALINQTAEEMDDNFDDIVNIYEDQELITSLKKIKK